MDNIYKNKIYKISKARKEAILDFIKRDKSLVLDIGCGDGSMGKILKEKKACVVHGLDISESAISLAKQNLDLAIINNISEDNFSENILKNKYDYIIISEVLEHFIEPEKILEKIKQVMHKGTEVIITVPNVLFWKNRLKIFLGYFNYTDKGLMDRGHIHFFSAKSLNEMFRKAGYHIISKRHHIPTRGTRFLGNIFPGLFAYQFIYKIKKNNKVIYTAIFGDKDNLVNPKYLPKDWDLVCFTDSSLKSDIWKVVKVKPELSDPVRNARKYKILAHRFLANYDYSIWVDGNMIIKGNVDELIYKYLSKDNIAIYDHNKIQKDKRNCIYKEAELLIKWGGTRKHKDSPEIIKKQIEQYKQEGYPENNGLISSMVLVRRHNENDVIKAMEDWWLELKKFSRRDQLSFNYVAWKNKLKFKYIKGDSTDNKYFKRTYHKKEQYEY